jgi:hypothetical protein
MTTITAVSGGGTWSSTSTWDTGTVPTAADDVVLGASSGAVTISAAAVCRSLDASAYTSTLTHNAAVALTIGDATAGTGNSALKLGSGMTYTLGNATTSAVVFASTSTTQQSITGAGKTLGNVTFNGSGGKYLLADTFTCTGTFLVSTGCTVDTGSQTITCLSFQISGTGAVATIGTSTINVTTTALNTYIFLRTSGGSFTAGAATINVVNASANMRYFAAQAANLSAATLNYTVAGSTGGLQFFGANSLGAFNFTDASNGRTLNLPASTTQTFGAFNVQGSAAGVISIISSTTGTAATITKASGFVTCDYLSLKDVTAAGGCSWYAGANSSVVSNVSGWFLTPPSNNQMAAYFGGVL